MHSLCNHIMAWRQILSGKICTDLGYSNILRFVCSIGISRGILWPSCLSHFRCFFRCCRRCYDIALVFPEQKHPWDKSKELQIWLEFLPGRSLFATRKSPPKLEENRLRREQGCLPELISATGRFGSSAALAKPEKPAWRLIAAAPLYPATRRQRAEAVTG